MRKGVWGCVSTVQRKANDVYSMRSRDKSQSVSLSNIPLLYCINQLVNYLFDLKIKMHDDPITEQKRVIA